MTTPTNDTTTTTAEPKSDLDNLAGLAAQVDADTSGTMPDGTAIADQPEPVNYAMEAAAMVDTFAALLAGYCPDAGALWTPEKKAAVTAALAPVMEKYGLTMGGLPCELVLIITAGPLLYQSARLVAAQMAREKAQAAQAAQLKKAEKATASDAVDKRTSGDHQPAPEPERHAQTALYTS